MKKLIFPWILMLAICLPALADDLDEARASGVKVLRKLEQRKRKDVWDSDVSDWFKQRMTADAFIANMTVIQAQLGGVASGRKLIQQNKAEGDVAAGYKGSVYSFTYGTTFPVTAVYETIVLIKENGSYKVSGINFVPNPNK